MSIQKFITAATALHGSKYLYSSANYVNYHTKLIIICPTHGPFEQTPATHLRGSGCKECFYTKIRQKSAEFVAKCVAKHGLKYDYSVTNYTSNKQRIKVKCLQHGIFEVLPYNHLINGHGCGLCYEDTKVNSTDKFKRQAILVHGNKYNYDRSVYIDDSTPIIITCKIHGDFKQKKRNHLSGYGCQKCAKGSCILSNDSFIAKASLTHNNQYNYASTVYEGSFKNVIITCKTHGDFEQMPSNHLKGAGCPKCTNGRLTTEEFIDKANQTHNNKYDYSLSTYTTSHDKLIITCNKHGNFEQKACNHLQGQGCPQCPTIISKPQQEIVDFIRSVYNHEILINDRKTIKGLELDIVLPKANLAIEYNGLYWHSYNIPESAEQKSRHQTKAMKAKAAYIDLIQIFENNWLHKSDIIKSMIKHKLRLSQRIYARNCTIDTARDTTDFFNSNHLQGDRCASHHISLIYDGNIIGACSYSKHSKYDYELIRMAFKNDIAVIGGVSKLIRSFKRVTNNGSLFTYANLLHSNAAGYLKSGFQKLGITKPGYFYYHGSSKAILSRQQCQKRKLNKLLPLFDANASEAINMFNNGYRRVWDAGHYALLLR